jgi:hypothetical protein
MASICLAAFDVQHSEHCKLFPPRAQWACVYEPYSTVNMETGENQTRILKRDLFCEKDSEWMQRTDSFKEDLIYILMTSFFAIQASKFQSQQLLLGSFVVE